MVFGYGLALIAFIFGVGGALKHGFGPAPAVLFVCAGVFGFTTVFAPEALRPGYAGWMRVAHLIGGVITTVLLTVVFAVVFTPVSLVLKLLGKDHLDRRLDRAAGSYWLSREGDIVSRERLEQQF